MDDSGAATALPARDAAAADVASALESAKLQALYHFAYGLSHEINNPLANIATRAQTLLAGESDPERRRKLATIVQQAFRAHEMIADLMLFARPPALRLQSVDLIRLADTVLAEMQDQARDQGTTLTRTGDAGPLMATADPTHLAVALKALIQNSLEAIQHHGSIEISVTSAERGAQSAEHTAVPPPHFAANLDLAPRSALRGPRFLLSVTDSGPGVRPEIRPHIFDPFFSGREAGRGLGLGLSKAWRIVELHGGRIDVENQATSGAKFTISLPRITESLADAS
jgi:signal transduction histidine kinase